MTIDLDIQLVFSDDVQSEPLRVPAVWCGARRSTRAIRSALSFLPLDAERAEYLTMFLRYLEDDHDDEAENAKPSIDDRFA